MSDIKYRNFDFSIAFQEFHPPMPLSFWATDAFLNTYKRITGTDVGFIYVIINNELTGYMQTGSSDIIWQSIKDRLTSAWLDEELSNFENHLVKIKEIVEPARTRDYTREELIDLFESIYKELGETYPYSNAFYMLSPEVENQIINKLKVNYSEADAGQMLAKFSKPSRPTFLEEYTKDTQSLADELKNKYGILSSDLVREIYSSEETVKNKLNKLRNKYFCFSGLNAGQRTVESIIPDIVSKMNSVAVKDEEFSVPKEVQDEVSMLSTMIYFKDEISTFLIPYVHYGLERQWKVAADLLGLSIDEMNQLMFTEVIDELKSKTFSKTLIDQRKRCTFFFHAPFVKTEITEGDEAWRQSEMIKNQVSQTDYSNVTEIKGKTGSVGKVSGPVQVIMNSSGMNSFKEGSVLVAVYTAPEFVPVMKKAIAIVTDTGGITCHAAIVSRELNKPCVVGTKIATQVLKDGDVVEVDADNGVVRIIK